VAGPVSDAPRMRSTITLFDAAFRAMSALFGCSSIPGLRDRHRKSSVLPQEEPK
jgi:hypothetical protein